jgi:hypothetical protein
MSEPRQLQSLLDPSDTTIKIVEPHRQADIIGVQAGDRAFEAAQPDDYFVQFLARRLFGADRPKHVEDSLHNLDRGSARGKTA